jgi:hypothetical protein
MPILPENKKRYPPNWGQIRAGILAECKNRCEFCSVENGTIRNGKRIVLTSGNMNYLKRKIKMINEKLVKKITKLLAMATKGTGNEAVIALKKARALMEEHGLTQDDIELFTVDIPETKRKQRWVCMLHYLVSTFSGVVSISGYKTLIFAGHELGVNVARELFYYLKNEILRKTSETEIVGRKGKNDFKIGIVMGLHERMEKIGGWRDMELKRHEVTKKYFSKMKCKDRGKHYVDRDIFDIGKQAAENIDLNRQAGYNGASAFLAGGK